MVRQRLGVPQPKAVKQLAQSETGAVVQPSAPSRGSGVIQHLNVLMTGCATARGCKQLAQSKTGTTVQPSAPRKRIGRDPTPG